MSGTWAKRGSQLQLQLQLYVNHRPEALNAAIQEKFPEIQGDLRWRAPLEADGFREPRDRDFLAAIGCEDLVEELAAFWPARGPVWDGLAVIATPEGRDAVLLVEAKSHPAEVYGGGSGATTEASVKRIRESLETTQRRLGIAIDADRWIRPLRPELPGHSSVYQSANRYAHLYWLREKRIDAWLVHVLFYDDPTYLHTTREEWEEALPRIEEDLGLRGVDLPYAGHVFLPGLNSDDFARDG
jgi:hypothetical protein